MRYINPFRLFSLPEYQFPDEVQIAQVSKRLSNLQDEAASAPLSYAGVKLDTTILATLINEWEDLILRNYHWQLLTTYRKLYNFLEYGHLGLFRNPEAQQHALWADPNFVLFIQDYLDFAYAEALELAVRQRDTEAMEQLSHHKLPINGKVSEQPKDDAPELDSEAYNSVAESLKSNTSDIQQLAAQKELLAMSEREILSYIPDQSINIYNSLPDQFSLLRNELGSEIQNLAFVLNDKLGRSDGAEALVRQGLKLKLDAEIRKGLESMLAHHRRKMGIPLWFIIGISIIVLLFLIKYLDI